MPTGSVYDDIFTKHDFLGHPENASRLAAIMQYLTKSDILPSLTLIPARLATREELEACHRSRHIDLVAEIGRGDAIVEGQSTLNTHIHFWNELLGVLCEFFCCDGYLLAIDS